MQHANCLIIPNRTTSTSFRTAGIYITISPADLDIRGSDHLRHDEFMPRVNSEMTWLFIIRLQCDSNIFHTILQFDMS